MTAKYGFSNIHEALIEDIKAAYPTKWEDFQAAKVLGEDLFGLPKPHPNAVLNLFLEQKIEFALPFAAYRASLAGFLDLVSDKPGMVIPRLTLASIIHGMGKMYRGYIISAYSILHFWNPEVCPEESCVLHARVSSTKGSGDALGMLFDCMLRGCEGDMLSPLSLGTLACTNCAKRLERNHLGCRKEFIWVELPSLLGWERWEGV